MKQRQLMLTLAYPDTYTDQNRLMEPRHALHAR